jgi:PAS domain S-box-containing protein
MTPHSKTEEGQRVFPEDSASTKTPDREQFYERRYNMLLSAIPFSVLAIDPHLRVVGVNENFLKKARRTEDDTVGKRLAAVLPAAIVEDMAMEKRVRYVFETKEATRGERMAYRAPGMASRVYYHRIIPIISDDIVEEVLLFMEDVTEQTRLGEEIRQVERHLASVVESASDLIISTDPEGRIVTWNAAVERATGYGSSDVSGRFFYDVCAAECRPKVRTSFDEVELLERMSPPEWSLATAGGPEVPVSWVFSAMRDERGTVVGIVAIGRNLTERRKLETQILQSRKLAALGVMAGGIAHEIRNPLAVCASAAQFLLEEKATEAFVQECAQKIVAGVQRASFIIENLLQFARPGAPEGMHGTNLAYVVANTVALVANEARLKKVSVLQHIPETSVEVNGNVNMLEQVLMNLIFNAFKAMPDGGTLEIVLGAEENEAVLSISDSGCGIRKEDLDKIFDPFYTTRSVGEGTGLGLSLCYAIIRQHSGVIKVDSTEGKGTTVTLRLPRAQGQGERNP